MDIENNLRAMVATKQLEIDKLKQKTEYEKQVIRFVVVLEVFLVKSAHLLIGGFYD